MISLSKSLARKYAADGVLVNSAMPGLIYTAMWERTVAEIAQATGSTTDKVLEEECPWGVMERLKRSPRLLLFCVRMLLPMSTVPP